MGLELVDFHFHYIPKFYREAIANGGGRTPHLGYLPEWTPQIALEMMDQYDIALGILQLTQPGVSFMDDGKVGEFARRCNDNAAELIAQYPTRFGCFGAVPMHDMTAAIAEASHCIETARLEGISMFSSYGDKILGDDFFDPLMEYLNSQSVVVHIHPDLLASTSRSVLTGLDYPWATTRTAVNLLFGGTLERFPNIRFILSHGGGTIPFVSYRLSVIPMIDKRMKYRSREEVYGLLKCFWYDTAIAAGPHQLASLLRTASHDRIVFGSDFPYANSAVTGEEVEDIRSSDVLSEDLRAMIANKNAAKLFPRRAAQFSR